MWVNGAAQRPISNGGSYPFGSPDDFICLANNDFAAHCAQIHIVQRHILQFKGDINDLFIARHFHLATFHNDDAHIKGLANPNAWGVYDAHHIPLFDNYQTIKQKTVLLNACQEVINRHEAYLRLKGEGRISANNLIAEVANSQLCRETGQFHLPLVWDVQSYF